MSEQSIRLECLRIAQQIHAAGHGGGDVLKLAEQLYSWVTRG